MSLEKIVPVSGIYIFAPGPQARAPFIHRPASSATLVSVRVCVRPSVCPRKREDSPNSIGFTAPSGGIISRVDFRNPQKIKENREKPNEGRIGRDPVLGPFLRSFLKIKITQCVTATKIWLLEIATVYEGKTAKWRPILELQRGPGATLALRVLSSLTIFRILFSGTT